MEGNATDLMDPLALRPPTPSRQQVSLAFRCAGSSPVGGTNNRVNSRPSTDVFLS
jgi:hypothetical protein